MKIITLKLSEDEAGIILKSLEIMSECIPEGMKGAPKKARTGLIGAVNFLIIKVKAGLDS